MKRSNNDSSYVNFGGLVLPAKVVAEMLAEFNAERNLRKKEQPVEQKAVRGTRAEQAPPEKEAQPAEQVPFRWPNRFTDHPGPVVRIFDKADVEAYVGRFESECSDNDHRRRAKSLIKLLETTGEYRKLATISEHWRSELDVMSKRFPNFDEVIDYVRISCALAERSDRILRLSLLLAGPAGTGKSMFAQTLAQWIGGGYACIRYEAAQSSSEMAGSSSFWSNTKPGKPFALLTEQDFANPTFFLDEIDKVTADRYAPLGALYALLEPGTAREHTDQSWPFLRLDCSRINYIAACNDPDNIPQPLLSRLRKFDIPAPTLIQAHQIATHIIEEETAKAALELSFSEGAMAAVCHLAPRRMRQMVQEAMGRALYHQRDTVLPDDVVIEHVRRAGIGFLS